MLPQTGAEANELLLRSVRSFNESAALADADAKTTQQVLGLLEQAAALLSPTRNRLYRRPFEEPFQLRELGGGAWETGTFSTTQPRLKLEILEDEVHALWKSGPLDEGPPGMVHGGISAFLLDMISGVLVQSMGVRAVTAQLNIKYMRRVPLEEDLRLRASLLSVDGRKYSVRGEVILGDTIAVESSGLFITI